MLSPILRLSLAASIVIVLAGGAGAGPGHDHSHEARARIDAPAPDFTLTAIDGKKYSLSDYKGKYVVLEWHNPDCPFVRKHYGSSNMQKLQSTYAEKGVVWFTICSSAPGKQGYYETEALTKMTAGDAWKATAYLQDPTGEVGRSYAARTTPHMYIINPEGVLIYAGAIDNKPSTKKADVDGATNYVEAALDEAMADKEVTVKTTTPYGCSVKYAPSQ